MTELVKFKYDKEKLRKDLLDFKTILKVNQGEMAREFKINQSYLSNVENLVTISEKIFLNVCNILEKNPKIYAITPSPIKVEIPSVPARPFIPAVPKAKKIVEGATEDKEQRVKVKKEAMKLRNKEKATSELKELTINLEARMEILLEDIRSYNISTLEVASRMEIIKKKIQEL